MLQVLAAGFKGPVRISPALRAGCCSNKKKICTGNAVHDTVQDVLIKDCH
jgi:hypothetical protein